jgi:hypothetical protein
MQEWEPGFEEDTEESPGECWGCGASDPVFCACEEECPACGHLFCSNAEHDESA